MKEVYKTVNQPGQDEIIINKSRFIGYSMPITEEQEALDFIEHIKSKHRDATHNVYAYVLGEDSNIQRYSDDGEPSGTAGIPALEVIKKEDLRNLVVVVTRYFGGVKLGGGGLIRAYTKGAKIGIDAGLIVDMTLHKKIKLTIEYTMLGKVENFLLTNGINVEETIFDENVNMFIYIKSSELKSFIQNIDNMTNGNNAIEYVEDKHLPLLNGKRVKESKING